MRKVLEAIAAFWNETDATPPAQRGNAMLSPNAQLMDDDTSIRDAVNRALAEPEQVWVVVQCTGCIPDDVTVYRDELEAAKHIHGFIYADESMEEQARESSDPEVPTPTAETLEAFWAAFETWQAATSNGYERDENEIRLFITEVK